MNSATVEELDRLPGIGPVLAGRIVAYREEHGPYRAASELIAIEGIGKIKLAKIEELLFVEPTE